MQNETQLWQDYSPSYLHICDPFVFTLLEYKSIRMFAIIEPQEGLTWINQSVFALLSDTHLWIICGLIITYL